MRYLILFLTMTALFCPDIAISADVKVGPDGNVYVKRLGQPDKKILSENDSGYVGIGTKVPLTDLHVYTTSDDVAPLLLQTTAANGRISTQYANDAENWYMGIDGGNSDGFFVSTAAASGDVLSVTRSGNLGVGVTPTDRLHVYEDSTGSPGVTIQNPNAAGAAEIEMHNDSGYVGGVIAGSASNGTFPDLFGLYSGTGYDLNFWTNSNSTPKMVIQTDGDVGVGTATPAADFEIETTGATQFQIDAGANTNPQISLAESGSIKWYMYNNNTDDSLVFYDNTGGGGVSTFVIESGGDVGIGTATPATKLHVYTTSDDVAPLLLQTTATDGRISSRWMNDSENWYMGIDGGASDGFFISTGVASGDVLTITRTGSVKINTSGAFTEDLIVASDTNTAAVNILTPDTNGRVSARFANDAENWYMGIDGGNTDSFFISTGVASGDKFVVNRDGEVGIGTTNPLTNLHVYTTSDDVAPLLLQTTAANGRISTQYANDAENWYMGIDGGASDGFFISTGVASGDVLTLTRTGYVGIGASPATELDIVSTNPILRLSDSDATSGGKNSVGGRIEIYGKGTYNDRMGYIGYGTSANDDLTFYSDSGGDFDFQSNTTTGTILRLTDTATLSGDPDSVNSRIEFYGAAPYSGRVGYIGYADSGNDDMTFASDSSGYFNFITASSSVMTVTPSSFVSPVIYSSTSGSSANVYVDALGQLYRSTSSIRYKKDIQEYEKGLAEVMKMEAVTYKSKDESDKNTYAGFTAEQIDEIGLKEFVSYDEQGRPDALHYANMASILVKATQEQQNIIENQKAQITLMKTWICEQADAPEALCNN